MPYDFTGATTGQPLLPEVKIQIISQQLRGFSSGYDETVIEAIEEDNRVFREEELPNTQEDILESVIAWSEGVETEEVSTTLDRFGGDWRGALARSAPEERQKLLIKMIHKARSYDSAITNRPVTQLPLIGFEDDHDFDGTNELLESIFGQSLLHKYLISEIQYINDKVYVNTVNGSYFVPTAYFESLVVSIPFIVDYSFVAESLSNWNLDMNFSAKFRPLPIKIFSFVGQSINDLEELKDLPEDMRMAAYKKGNIVHEVGHMVFDYVLSAQNRNDWAELSANAKPLTPYAATYIGEYAANEENFCEALRLFACTPEFLQLHNPQVYDYIDKLLKELKKGEEVIVTSSN